MLARLLLLFTLVPLVEFFLLVQVERAIGLAGTIGLIFATGTLGAILARREGLRTLSELKSQTRRGVPSQTIVEGTLVLAAAAVLLTPGILTDACGFALLVPSIRRPLAAQLIAAVKARMAAAVRKQAEAFKAAVQQPATPPAGDVIDVEFETVEERQRLP